MGMVIDMDMDMDIVINIEFNLDLTLTLTFQCYLVQKHKPDFELSIDGLCLIHHMRMVAPRWSLYHSASAAPAAPALHFLLLLFWSSCWVMGGN